MDEVIMLKVLIITGAVAAATAFATAPSAHALTGNAPFCMYNGRTRVITCNYRNEGQCKAQAANDSDVCMTRAQAIRKEQATTGSGGMQPPVRR